MGRTQVTKIGYVSGSRADYGLMKRILFTLDKSHNYELTILICGMHLMSEHGNTHQEIERDGFNCEIIDTLYEGSARLDMAKFVGKTIVALTDFLTQVEMDTLILLGDRGEMLAGAIAGAYSRKLVVHLHGGDKTSTIDESARHAITKLAHIHLTATPDAYERVIKLGEQEKDVHLVGAPGLEGITEDLLSLSEINDLINCPKDQKYAVLLYHPVSEEVGESGAQMKMILQVLAKQEEKIVIIAPNSDAGNDLIQKEIELFDETNDQSVVFSNLERRTFRSLMNYANFMIGNSSAGIIEAASFKLPVINIGDRQTGRLCASNVIHIRCLEDDIHSAIQRTKSDPNYKQEMSKLVNPYGDGRTSGRVIDILNEINISSQLLQKRITY